MTDLSNLDPDVAFVNSFIAGDFDDVSDDDTTDDNTQHTTHNNLSNNVTWLRPKTG